MVNMEEQIVDTIGTCYQIVYEKDSFMIALFRTDMGDISVKGDMYVSKGQKYKIKAIKDNSNPKYKNSYQGIQVRMDINLDEADEKVLKSFLDSFLSNKQAKEIMKTLPNPIEIFEKGDIEALVKVKGIGVATAERIINNFQSQKDYSEAFVFFADYDISEKLVKKICNHFGSVNEAIAVTKSNVYDLLQVGGIGFKKADWIFLSNLENDPNDIRRVKAFTRFAFEQAYSEGHTWLSPQQYVETFNEQFYSGNFRDGVNYINESPEYTTISVELPDGTMQKRICLTKVYQMEVECVMLLEELIRSESKLKFNNVDEIIHNIEESQGWEYTDEQKKAIQYMLDHNLVMLQGLSGSGKSSSSNAFLSVLQQNGYSYMAGALSGKAADNLSQVTGQKANTIHSTLQPRDDGFFYGNKNKLPTNSFLLDELSMVNLEIFLALLRAIPRGAKLIMLGDFGQLEAIGVGVMGAFIKSKKVPMILLKKIHRQAQKSAIITHSIEYRNGRIPKEIDFSKIEEPSIYGENEDLEYIFLEDENKIGVNTLVRFKDMLNVYDIKDIQILCSTKKTGAVSTRYLNENAQRIANPQSLDKPELLVGFKDNSYTLRLGDKVINTKNTRDAMSPDGKKRPIFNGNTGIIIEINTVDKSMIIDFDGIGEVVVTSTHLNDIELAYAITIHKSQGSTIKCVLLALPYHFLLNSKELLYTGMTRAKDYQIIITTPKALKTAVKKSNATKKNVNIDHLLINYENIKNK